MKVSPYLQFNGNCSEAIALYEKAFGTQAHVLRYKDAPPSEGYQPPAGTEDFVMHAHMPIGSDAILLCDVPAEMPCTFGNGIAVMVELDSLDAVKSAFEALSEGGVVGMELQDTFWSPCFGSLSDKFGVG